MIIKLINMNFEKKYNANTQFEKIQINIFLGNIKSY